jgi:hypothetical protein
MPEHPVIWTLGALAGLFATIAAAVATRVRLVPEVIDFTIVPNAAGTFGLLFALYGASRRFGPDRLGRVTLFGNLVGGVIAVIVLLLALARDVLS